MVTLKNLIINAPAVLREILDQIRGKVALIRHFAAFRPGDIDTPLASAKAAMRAFARRWLWLQKEIISHDKELERRVTEHAPDLMASHGIATLTVAEIHKPTPPYIASPLSGSEATKQLWLMLRNVQKTERAKAKSFVA